MEAKQLKVHLTQFGVASIISTMLSIAAIAMPYWMNIKGDKSVGVYQSQSHGSAQMFGTVCDGNFSEIECGILDATKISAVVSIMFGGIASFIYFLPPKIFASLPAFMAISGSCGQLIFSIMTFSLFIYFKQDYFTDDGVNHEYPTFDASDLSYSFAFWIWVTGSIVSFLIVSLGYFVLAKTGCMEKPRSDSMTAFGDYMEVRNKD